LTKDSILNNRRTQVYISCTNIEVFQMSRFRAIVLCVALTEFLLPKGFAETKTEVAHFWTSKGEAKAVSVLKKAFEDRK